MAARPLSPHLQVYRWYFTMALSIAHRATGIALVVGLVFLVWWLMGLAAGPEAFATVHGLVGSWVGRLVLFGLSLALWYHLVNGIRHLAWDMGWGLELRAARRSGWLTVGLTVALTLATWLAVALAG